MRPSVLFIHRRALLCATLLVTRLAPCDAATRGPRLPFPLPSAADAEKCSSARAAAFSAMEKEAWAEAAKQFRLAIDAFPQSQTDTYNLACSLSRAGDRDGAWLALKRARDLGGLTAFRVAADTDLELLHGDPAWNEFLVSLRQEAVAIRSNGTADELAQSREEAESLVEKQVKALEPLERLLGSQHAVAMSQVLLWKADSLEAMARRTHDPAEADRLNWDAFLGLLDGALNPAYEPLAFEVSQRASSPAIANSKHWIDAAHAAAIARWGVAFLDSVDERSKQLATDRKRADLLEIAASAPDQPGLVGVLTTLTSLTTSDLALSVRVYERLIKVATDAKLARTQAQVVAPGVVLAAEGMPGIQAVTTEGRSISNATLTGHVTLFDFWATWCGPCTADLPNVRAIHSEFGPRGLDVIGVAVEGGPLAERAAFAKWCTEHEIGWPQVLDAAPKGERFIDALGIRNVPNYLLIDRTGRVVAAGGQVALLRPAIAMALPATPSSPPANEAGN